MSDSGCSCSNRDCKKGSSCGCGGGKPASVVLEVKSVKFNPQILTKTPKAPAISAVSVKRTSGGAATVEAISVQD